MSKVKVVLRVSTIGAKAGETIEVDSAEAADQLVADGLANRVSGAKRAAAEGDKA